METLDAYEKFRESAKLPRMWQGAPKLENMLTLTEPDEVWAELQVKVPTEGWLQFQSCQQYFTDGLPTPEPDWGCLLAAEAVTAQGHSLSLRQNTGQGWTLATHSHDEQGTGLCDEVRHRLHGVNGNLVYRRYWSDAGERGYIQHLTLLTAIEINADSEE